MATITRARPARPPATTDRRRRITARPAAWIVWGVVIFFFLNLLGVVASVLVSSFGRRWFDTWLPDGYTTSWYGRAWTSSRFCRSSS